ncbi:MAG: AraC family transcriptional regulator [Lachnospiraceae bacterium]|nr:AraC family transcriptional regulator [Lachnospiraceae bacterium]
MSAQNKDTYEMIQVPKNTGVRFYTSVDTGSYIPSHWHPAIEIIYMLEGELTVTVENTSRLLSAGQCILINPSIIHATQCISPNKAIVFQIPMDFISLYLPEVTQLLFTIDDPSDNPIRQTKIDIFKDTLLKMQVANDIRPEGFVLRFNSLLFEVLFQLYHNFSTRVFHANRSQRTRDLDRLNEVLSYTEAHYNEPVALDDVAGVACLETGYFCRFFKKYMGTTFLEYQNELRLSRIYHDLVTTQDTVQLILERHGFTNYKLFRRMFQERFGATPSQIRK